MNKNPAPANAASAPAAWPEPPADAMQRLQALHVQIEACLREGLVAARCAQWQALDQGVRAALDVLAAQERTDFHSTDER